MKAIDFTKPGGFPLTQDQVNYLQRAYTECINAIAMMGGDSTAPIIISGMTVTNPATGTYNITDGWFFYNNELIRFNAGGVTGASGASDVYAVITASAGTLIFNDGSTPGVILDKSAQLQVLPTGTATDATHFPLSALIPFGRQFGIANRETTWHTMSVSTAAAAGGVTGTVYYKKDFTANTLHIRGLLSANNAQNFTASPSILYYLMGTLPTTFAPSNNVYFSAYYFVANLIKDDLGVSWIKQINCSLNSVGQLYINWIKPDVSVSAYGVNFNAIIPLD